MFFFSRGRKPSLGRQEVKMEAVMRTNLRRGRGSGIAEATAVPEAGSGVGCEEGTLRDRNGWRMDMGG